METAALGLAVYCVPCRNRCRYCLLSSCEQACGVSYRRGKALAERLFREAQDAGGQLSYYIGYSMDTPDLTDYIRFCREYGMPGAKFLQMDGFHFMDDTEIARLMDDAAREGVETMNFTFYGSPAYHDAFAGRKGDHALLSRMLTAALRSGIRAHVTVPLLRDNMAQSDETLEAALKLGASDVRFFLPSSKGRGWSVRAQRLTDADYQALSADVRTRFGKTPLKTEAEWLAGGAFPEIKKKYLTVVPTADSIAHLEQAGYADILRAMEEKEARFRAAMPEDAELARMYGRRENRQLFRFRDLTLLWRQTHARLSDNAAWDFQDESRDFVTYLYE